MAGKKRKAKGKSDHRMNGAAEPFRNAFCRQLGVAKQIQQSKPLDKCGRDHWTEDEVRWFEDHRRVTVKIADELGLSIQQRMTLQAEVQNELDQYEEPNEGNKDVDESSRTG